MSLGTDQSLAKPGTGRHPASSRATSIHAISFLFWHVYLIVRSPIIDSYLLAILQIPYYPPPRYPHFTTYQNSYRNSYRFYFGTPTYQHEF